MASLRLRRYARFACLLLALAFAAGLGPAVPAISAAQAQNATKPLSAPLSFVDAKGRNVTTADFPGQWLLIYFGYTHCSDLCPLGLTTMSTALDQIGPAARHIQPLFVTVDPERDHGPMIQIFSDAFDKRMIGLTGSLEQIATAARQLDVKFSKVQAAGDDYTVDHSSTFTLIGPDRRTFETLRMAEAHLLAARLIEVLAHAGVPLDEVGNVGAYR